MAIVTKALSIILPKKRANDKGASYTSTFQESNANQTLAAPGYRDHLTDIFTSRAADNSRTLLKQLFKHDPDVSAAVNAYLTVADQDFWFIVRDADGVIDRDGHKIVDTVLRALTTRTDYTKPANFSYKPGLRTLFENFRHMILLRGGIGAELVIDKTLLPSEIRHVDLATVEWKEKAPGVYIPEQSPPGASKTIPLDIPTFFVAFFRRDPTEIYTHSPFVSSINTIAARQQVINDLYRIMQKTGYPRQHVKVIEEVLRKNAPAAERADEKKMKTWLNARLAEINATVAGLRPDSVFVHFDSVEPTVPNGKVGMEMDVSAVIETLNAQNQAALKVMSTVIGRGESGVNTSTTETRIFALNAEQLNRPIAELMSHLLTLAVRLNGSESVVEFGFDSVELRPALELEPQLTMKQSRLMDLLSRGLISDDEFHMEMFGRIRPDAVPELSGTNFLTPAPAEGGVDVSKTSPNSDPMGRSLAPEGSKSARSNTVKKNAPRK